MHIFVIIALTLFTGCGAQRSVSITPPASSDAEIEVIISVLQDDYVSRLPAGTALVIEDAFSVARLRGDQTVEQFTASLLHDASTEVPKELIKDFCDKNITPEPVWPALTSRLSVKLLSPIELESIFLAGPNEKKSGWDRFYERYPKSPGIITLSRVGFSRRGDLAMLYVGNQSHYLAGRGQIRVFRKQDGKWVEQPTIIGPVWVS